MYKRNIIFIFLVIILSLFMRWNSEIFCQKASPSKEIMTKIIAVIEEIRMGNEEHVSELIKLGTEAVPILIPYLEDENTIVREDVIIVLGEIGDKQAIVGLSTRLGDTDSNVRRRTIDALSKFNPAILTETAKEIVPALIKYLRRWEENSYKAALIIGKIGDEALINELTALLKEARTKKEGTGGEAIIAKKIEDALLKALAKLNYSEAMVEILAGLKSKDVSVRFDAIEKIAYVGQKDTVKYLIDLLDDKENAINIGISGTEYYLRITDVVINVIGELYKPIFSFEIKKGFRYTDEQIEEVRDWYLRKTTTIDKMF